MDFPCDGLSYAGMNFVLAFARYFFKIGFDCFRAHFFETAFSKPSFLGSFNAHRIYIRCQNIQPGIIIRAWFYLRPLSAKQLILRVSVVVLDNLHDPTDIQKGRSV